MTAQTLTCMSAQTLNSRKAVVSECLLSSNINRPGANRSIFIFTETPKLNINT